MTFAAFMSELFKIVLDKVREQGFTVILLLCAVAGLFALHEKTEEKLEKKIAVVESDLKVCNDERGKLSVQVADLLARFDVFTDEAKKLKKKNK